MDKKLEAKMVEAVAAATPKENEPLGRFFTYREFLTGYSKHKLPIPQVGVDILIAARQHTHLLMDPARLLVGPLRVTSWYRTAELNKLVYGHPRSQHRDGTATDVVPLVLPLRLAFEKLRTSDLPYDELIVYPLRGFLHLSSSATPRRKALVSPIDKKYIPADQYTWSP